MKSRRRPLEVDIEKYEIGKGMEDGFERLYDVVTKGMDRDRFPGKDKKRRRNDRMPLY